MMTFFKSLGKIDENTKKEFYMRMFESTEDNTWVKCIRYYDIMFDFNRLFVTSRLDWPYFHTIAAAILDQIAIRTSKPTDHSMIIRSTLPIIYNVSTMEQVEW